MARLTFVDTTQGGSPAAESSMKALLDEYASCLDAKPAPTRSSFIRGEVIAKSSKGFWVNYGGKTEAFAPGDQHDNDRLEIGRQCLFEVIADEDSNGCVQLGLAGGLAWEELLSAQRAGTILSVQVRRIQRSDGKIAGVCVAYGKINGFIPFSLLAIAAGKVETLKEQSLDVLVDDVVPESGRLIFNRRKLEDQRNAEQQRQREEIIATLKPGTLLTQLPFLSIAKTKDGNEFGIFVELSKGVKALIHRGEIPRHSALKNCFKEGDLVDAVVMPMREQNGRKEIALSLKAAQVLRKKEFFAAHPVGTILKGNAVRKVDFGTFVCLSEEAGIDGLLHNSEYFQCVEPAIGSTVQVRIIRIDEQRCTVGLSMRPAGKA